MVDYPYPSDLVGNVPGNPIEICCEYFEDLTTKSKPAAIFEEL